MARSVGLFGLALASAMLAVSVLAAVIVSSGQRRALTAALQRSTRPVVYYYLKEPAQTQLLNETDGGDEAEFSCSADSLIELSAQVQAEWDACLGHEEYQQPNKGAKRRRLLGFQLTVDHDLNWLKLEDNKVTMQLEDGFSAKSDARLEAAGHHLAGQWPRKKYDPTEFNGCMKNAAWKACENLASCPDPICKNYYNDVEIESLCGICSMAGLIDDGGCFPRSALTWKYLSSPRSGPGVPQQVLLANVKTGDFVLSAAADSTLVPSRSLVCVWIHAHARTHACSAPVHPARARAGRPRDRHRSTNE